ncbi:hypothetical protein [Agromyces aureus]|uniref:DUF1453 domain-containing protein n=1 Tax=Agromyces aureus TaxID=453304 RepID=A0A191WD44_9MICO|nr:hypothetical protein [Agromyces aureus]ANJ26147.1 hypothetical protein ATC03_04785 [Agromyces aureus]
MQPIQLVLLLGMVVYAIVRQTRISTAGGPARFKLAFIYAGIGVASLLVGGWSPPEGLGWLFLLGGIVLSAVVGVLRGRLTKVWVADDGQLLRQGTWLTVSLFVAVIAVKVALGVIAGFAGIADGSSFAEVLVIVAIMIAVQAEIVHRRARRLSATRPSPSVGTDMALAPSAAARP